MGLSCLSPVLGKKIASLSPSLPHRARPSTLNTCGTVRTTPPLVVRDDQSSTDEHDPRSADVTADNFIDNCHASNHPQTHSACIYVCILAHLRARRSVHSYSTSSNRIAAATMLVVVVVVAVAVAVVAAAAAAAAVAASSVSRVPRESAPVAEIRARVCVRDGRG